MRYELLIAGRGGQGILLIGRVLGIAASKYCNLYVTCSESYVAETRGGDSRTDLIISDNEEELDFIKVRKADIAIFMHQTQLVKFSSMVKDNGTVYIDESYVSELPSNISWRVYKAPYTKLAEREIGSIRVANMVALGHLIGTTKLINPGVIEMAIDEVVGKEWSELNKKAFRLGLSISI